ncbi:Arc domain-containing protein [Pseudomonas chlororaphis subsp. aurantiaca]|uniref:Arc family DNA-binding protein n=1 Tax=Pseudomonas chlororaphis TaxID=587753 RepID=UPI00086640A5|nr:Arc family DNA-binding protein [Pseudomonas chlororaphis]BAV77746.1 Arc domain-containing protein [Pseudomonas chlororaphis subsp. aurantiaca]
MSEQATKPESHLLDKFVVRLPDGLRPSINTQARANHRSMNGEIIFRLERSLQLEELYENQRRLNAILLQRIEELEARTC